MGARTLLLLAYVLAVCAYALAAGNGNNNGLNNIGANSGNNNGNYNLGVNNGNGNGNSNTGNLNGNGNGNLNTGNLNGNGNGNGNLGNLNGGGNGNNNLGNRNGNGNGNFNSGSNNGNNNGNNNIGSGNGNGNGNGNANGKGDPIMTGFGGRAFEFLGQPGSVYSLVSEKFHKINTALKLGVMWDHNGTYMEGFGFQYRDQQVQVKLNAEDQMTVTMNGEPLVMTKGETELELIPFVEGGELMMLWQKHREGLGEAVEITTNMLQLLVWVTPAGTVDDGGLEQPAYLNFDIALMGPPAGNQMEGIIGETYNRMLVGDAVKDPNSQYYLPDDYTFRGKGAEETYIVDGYFGETADTMFAKQEHKRVLIEEEARIILQFPLRALGRAAGLSVASKPVTLHANGGRKGRFL